MKLMILSVLLVGILSVPGNALAFSVTVENVLIQANSPNLTFTGNAGPFWQNTKTDTSFNASNGFNYVDIYVSVPGTFTMFTPTAPAGSIFSIFKVVGVNGEAAELVGRYSHPDGNRLFYLQPGEYIVKAGFNGATPRLLMDFFPDNPSGACINLMPGSSSVDCNNSWLPAQYKREVAPFIDNRFENLKLRIGAIDLAKRTTDMAYDQLNNLYDAAQIFDMTDALAGQMIDDKLNNFIINNTVGVDYPNVTFAAQQIQSHIDVAGDLFLILSTGGVGTPTAWAKVSKLALDDAVSITSNATGLWALQNVAERSSELLFARMFLEKLLRDYHGDFNKIQDFYGTIDTAEAIDVIAASQGLSNWPYLSSKYDRDKAAAIVNEAIRGFGSWATVRRTMANPFNDVDKDGISNLQELADGTNPNDPTDPPAPLTPVSVASASSVSVNVNDLVTLDGSASYDLDSDLMTYSWELITPVGSSSSLSSTSSAKPTFVPDKEGPYTARLTVSDDTSSSKPITLTVEVADVYPNIELVYDDDGPHIYISDVTIAGTCNIKHLGSYTVPAGEKWTQIKFAASSGDIVLLANKGSVPELSTSSKNCSNGYTQTFNSDREYDYYPGTNIFTWNTTINAGETVYLAAFTYDGVSNHSFNTKVWASYDLDGDNVPDYEEDPVCRNNPLETFDSDGDLICNNEDKFDNDPSAWQDSDGDGCPNAINGTSTTGLILDQEPSLSTICIDADGDLVDDRETDLFLNDINEWADADGDKVGDNADKFDNDAAASVDSDGDGAPNSWNYGKSATDSTTGLVLDAFPGDSAAAIDTDGDLYPSIWNIGKTQADSTTGLVLDVFPDDINEWKDSDIDGVGDNSDPAPNDPNKSTNVPPSIDAIPDQTVKYSMKTTLNIVATDLDNEAISYSLRSAPPFVVLNGDSIEIDPTVDAAGTYRVVVGASDGYSLTIAGFDLIVPAAVPVTLSVTKYGSAIGSIVSSPAGLICGEACVTSSGAFFVSDVVVLTASELPGATFDNWGGAATQCNQISGNTCTVTLTADTNISAFFKIIDSDGDLVGDIDDAFPNDIAASVDSDGDGYPDSWNSGYSVVDSTTGLTLDVFPNDITEWADSDGDGLGDNMDAFPSDIAASVDSDDDGHPDSWNSGYSVVDSTTGLTLDVFPNDITEWADTDEDGLGDNADAFPNDATVDSDSDGIPDSYEILNGLDPLVANAAGQDSDLDGFSDYHEYLLGLDPLTDNQFDTDTDNDGISDQIEITLGLDPLVADATADPDGDGLTNAEEIAVGTSPTTPNGTLPDSDGDGLPNSSEILAGLDQQSDNSRTDSDNDGVTDLVEYANGTLAIANSVLIDTDNDGLPDFFEIANGLDPTLANGPSSDADSDGISDYLEYQTGLAPQTDNSNDPDTDNDGISDLLEQTLGLDPSDASDAATDPDGDGISTIQEIALGTSPFLSNATLVDSDGDGLPDVVEIAAGLDPQVGNIATDGDNDGRSDLQEYQDGTLAIFNNQIADTDGDGLPDVWEIGNGLNPAISNLGVDSDADGLDDLIEYQLGTNPAFADSDSDGVKDGADAFPFDVTRVCNGDLDQNGSVAVTDALLALRMSVGNQALGSDSLMFGDVAPYVNGRPSPDGQLTAADALVILRKAVGLVNW